MGGFQAIKKEEENNTKEKERDDAEQKPGAS